MTNTDLGGGLVDALLDGNGHPARQSAQLQLLLVLHDDVRELAGQREQPARGVCMVTEAEGHSVVLLDTHAYFEGATNA